MAVIEVKSLAKTFRVPERGIGTRAMLRSLVKPTVREVAAVREISFTIDAGEVVGVLGPNGAGKTVTLKCIAGLLHPTRGRIEVLGHIPQRRERTFLRRLAMVSGHRAQLLWDLPVIDTFRMHKVIYDIPQASYDHNFAELVSLLDLDELLNVSVRRLSLGQRMRCELAVGLVHEPRVVLLDEPTLGLDLTAQRAIRGFLRAYRDRHDAAILITSHYMADLTELTERVLLIDHGRLAYDGPFRDLIRRSAPHRYLRLTLREPVALETAALLGDVVHVDGVEVVYRVPRTETAARAAEVLAVLDVVDLAIDEPEVERVVERLFAGGSDSDASGF